MFRCAIFLSVCLTAVYSASETIGKVKSLPHAKPKDLPPACRLECDFGDGNWCEYKQKGNWNLTLTQSDEELGYAIVDLSSKAPNNTAKIEVDNLNLNVPTRVTIEFMENRNDVVLKYCLDDPKSCKSLSNVGMKAGDNLWMNKTIIIPAGTKKFSLIGLNTGSENGELQLGVVAADDFTCNKTKEID